MAEVECGVEEVDLEAEDGDREIPGITATCLECGHTTDSFGQTQRSIARCLAMMREECPEGENNFYVAERGTRTGR